MRGNVKAENLGQEMRDEGLDTAGAKQERAAGDAKPRQKPSRDLSVQS